MRGVVQLITSNARGEDRTLMPFCGQGILSPANPEVSPRTKDVVGASRKPQGNGEEWKGISPLPPTLPRPEVPSVKLPQPNQKKEKITRGGGP